MEILFTHSNMPLSKIIMWGLNEPVSHFVLVFDNHWIIQSNLLGISSSWLTSFKKHSEIIYAIHLNLPKETENEILKKIMDNFDGSPYGWGEFLFFTWRTILKKLFKMPFPNKNKWGSKKGFLCTELFSFLPSDFVPVEIKNKDLAMVSPYNLYNLCLKYHLGRSENAYILSGEF